MNILKMKVKVLHSSLFTFHSSLQASACLVGPSGLEPPTSCLSGTRSNLLSYEPLWLVSDFSVTWTLFLGTFVPMVEMMEDSHRKANAFLLKKLTFFPWLQIEPPTHYWDQSPKSRDFRPNGGDDGIRTHDPLLAGQVLSQLSYTPIV